MIGKRLVVLMALGLALSSLPLFSSLYRSNSLGQRLELLESLQAASEHRYVLQVEPPEGGEEQTLFESGEVVKRIQTFSPVNGGTVHKVVETFYAADGGVSMEIETTYEHGLPQLIRTTRRDDSFVLLTHHAYNEGQLYETKELIDGELERLITYYRGEDGVLAGLRIIDLDGRVGSSYFTTDSNRAVYGEQGADFFTKLTFYPDNLIVQDMWLGDEIQVKSTVSYDEADRLVIDEVRGGIPERRIYGPDGLVVRLETVTADGSDRTVRYQYDAAGVLDQSVEVIEGAQTTRVETWYRDGKVETRTEWVDDIPVRATRFVADGTSVVTLFEQGTPYADITYAPDGKRVLSLEYRKER